MGGTPAPEYIRVWAKPTHFYSLLFILSYFKLQFCEELAEL